MNLLQPPHVFPALTGSHPPASVLGHNVTGIHQPGDRLLGHTRLDLKANYDKSVLVLFGQKILHNPVSSNG